ncbi:MAG TPA: tetratricopeptide repeat protein [Candidatus Obscuribacterales bacterium]
MQSARVLPARERVQSARVLSDRERVLVVLSAIAILSPSPTLALAESSVQLLSWQTTQNQGTTALDSNEYWKALPLLTEALDKARRFFGPSDLRLAKSLGELGRYYAVRGRFDLAEPYFEEEFRVKEQAYGRYSPRIVAPMGSLIRFYLMHGTAKKAQPLIEELVAYVEGKLKEESNQQNQSKIRAQKGVPLEGWAGTATLAARDPLLEWAITCDDLGHIYRLRGAYGVADRLFKAAFDVKVTILGREHLSIANSYDNLGNLCMDQKEYDEAESYFRDALEISEKILSTESPQVYSRLDKLGRCLVKQEKYAQAEELYLRATHFCKDQPKYGNEARALFALGCIYADQRKFASAAPVLGRALRLSERFNGPQSVALVPYLEKYAYVLYYLGRLSDAAGLRARAHTTEAITEALSPTVRLEAGAWPAAPVKPRSAKK